MSKIPLRNFQVALVDFDGTLVDSEPLYYRAYGLLLEENGHEMPWSLADYCAVAHSKSGLYTEELFDRFPNLRNRFPDRNRARDRRNEIYQELITVEKSPLIPGAEELLKTLAKVGLKIVIVTNSLRNQVETLASYHSIFAKVDGWVVKEEYTHRKPHPESYQLAMRRYCRSGDRTIGFEDSARGVAALQAAEVDQAVWLLPPDHLQDLSFLRPTTLVVHTLQGIFDLDEEEAVGRRPHGGGAAVLDR